MSEENVELARRGYTAISRRDLDGFLQIMDPDVVAIPRIIAIEGGELRGHEGIREWWGAIFRTFPDFDVEVLSVHAAGDITLAHLIARGHGPRERSAVRG